MAKFIDVSVCRFWRKERCINVHPCQFKVIGAGGKQGCTARGVGIDDPRRTDSAANQAYDELKRKGYLK